MDGQAGMDSVLGALGGAAAGVGGLVDEIATSLTGSKELGGLAGAAVDLLTGNIPGAIAEGVKLGKDVIETPPPTTGPGALPDAARAKAPCTGRDAAATAPPPGTGPESGAGLEPGDPARGYAMRRGVEPGGGRTGVRGTPEAPAEHPGPRGHPARPEGVRGHPVRAATDLQGILGDPSLSLEDKVAMLLSSLVDGLDGKIQDEMGQLASAQQGGSGGQSPGDVQQLQTQLQLTVQRRSQMLTLLSNLEGLFNQTSMQVISNIR